MNTWICGNSHLAALRNGYVKLDLPREKLKFFPFGSGKWTWERFSKIDEQGLTLTPDEFVNNLVKATGSTHFSTSDRWGICIGGHSPRLYGSPIWKWCRPSHLAEKNFRPISQGLIDSLISADHKFIYHFFEKLLQAKLDFFVIATPPPPKNFHGDNRLDEIDTIAFLEKLARQKFRNWVINHDIDYIEMPESITDSLGFIKPEYKLQYMHDGRRDGHHANENYGALMIENIMNYIAKKDGP